MDYKFVAEALAHFSSPIRLEILDRLQKEGEKSVTDLSSELGLSLSGVSQHLTRLRAAGIVEGRRESQKILYSIVSDPGTDLVLDLAERL